MRPTLLDRIQDLPMWVIVAAVMSIVLLVALVQHNQTGPTTEPATSALGADSTPSSSLTMTPAPSPSADTEAVRAQRIAELDEQWPGAAEFIERADAEDWDEQFPFEHRLGNLRLSEEDARAFPALSYGLRKIDTVSRHLEEDTTEQLVDYIETTFLPRGHLDGEELDEFNAERAATDYAIELFAPDLAEPLEEAIEMTENGFGNGTHIVGETIEPGTYTTTAPDGWPFRNAYWERTSPSGDILDNAFVTSAQSVTVTIYASDGQFTSRDFGFWVKVG